MEPVRFAIIGIGGFGESHLAALEALEKEGLGKLVAFNARNRAKYAETADKLEAGGAVWYQDYHEMLRADTGAEVICIPAGHSEHAPMTIEALDAGYHVLCEKPASTAVQNVDRMIEARDRAGKLVLINFQWMGWATTKRLKDIVCSGDLGDIKSVVGIGCGIRYDTYYERNWWAGKVMDGDTLILDGPICNPLNHILNVSLHFASTEPGVHAAPVAVRAERYRARTDIEGEDTGCVHAKLDSGADLYFYTSLNHPAAGRTTVTVTGTKGTALWSWDQLTVTRGGKTEDLSAPNEGLVENFRNMTRAVRGLEEINAPLEQSRNVVLTTNGVYESCPIAIPVTAPHAELRHMEESQGFVILDIAESIERAAAVPALFSDVGVPWAAATPEVSLVGYKGLDPAIFKK